MKRERAYSLLVERYQSLAANLSPEERWTWLMAAHVVGQPVFELHWDSHVRMLALAIELRDAGEVAGQLMRLALVPLGHTLGRLPAGNIGRSTVNALRPMRPPRAVRQIVGWALRA